MFVGSALSPPAAADSHVGLLMQLASIGSARPALKTSRHTLTARCVCFGRFTPSTGATLVQPSNNDRLLLDCRPRRTPGTKWLKSKRRHGAQPRRPAPAPQREHQFSLSADARPLRDAKANFGRIKRCGHDGSAGLLTVPRVSRRSSPCPHGFQGAALGFPNLLPLEGASR